MKLNLTFFCLAVCAVAFKPKGEWAFVEDDMHKEVRTSGEDPKVHRFEDYNFTKIDEQMFFKDFKRKFDNIVTHYDKEVQKIFDNPSYNNENVGPHLVELFGDNYIKLRYDIKELQIEMKAFIEKELDIFFLYKCQNKYFHETELFRKCSLISKELKKKLMFNNFFDFGYQNMILDIVREHEIDESFNEELNIKVESLKGAFKLMENILMFIDELYTERTTRRISKKYGKGININIHVHDDEDE